MKTHPLTLASAVLAAAITLTATTPVASAGTRSAPAQSHTHGRSLADWMVRYFEWLVGGGPDAGRGLRFLPLPAGEYAGGSFTLDDPGLLVGELDVTLKPGESFMLPLAAWLGEFYGDGSEDVTVPDSSMNHTEFLITIDGQTVAEKTADVSSPYYVPVTDLSEPILYDEPTAYGSIGALWVQGFAFVHGPLTPGIHVMHLHSTIFADNYGLAAVYENTWTINVRRH